MRPCYISSRSGRSSRNGLSSARQSCRVTPPSSEGRTLPQNRRVRKLRVITSALLTIFAIAFGGHITAVPATAASVGGQCYHFQSGLDAICAGDDKNFDYCTPYGWPAYVGNQLGAAMAYLDDVTVLVDTYAPTCGTQTDIGGYLDGSPEYNLRGTTIRGAAVCTKPMHYWGSGTSDQGSMIIHSSLIGTGSQFRKTLCHEIGHFVGLRHYSAPGAIAASCLVTGSSTRSTYSSDEIASINRVYTAVFG